MLEDSDLQINSVEDVKKAVSDIRTAVQSASKHADDVKVEMGAQYDRLKADLQTVSQRLAAIQNSAAQPTHREGEKELSRFLYEAKGATGEATRRVRLAGHYDDETATWHEGLVDASPVCDWQAELQDAVQTFSVVVSIRRKAGHPITAALCRSLAPKSLARVNYLLRQAPESIRRFFGDGSNIGAEWIPDLTFAQLEREMYLERRLAALFRTIQMPGKTLDMPYLTRGFKPYIKGVATSNDPGMYPKTNAETNTQQVVAKSLSVYTQVDEDASEDAIFAVAPIFLAELRQALVDAKEDAIINGDTAGTHGDTGIAGWTAGGRWEAPNGASNDHRRAWLGLRHTAIDRSCTSDGGSAKTYAGLQTAIALLDSPRNMGRLIAIPSPQYLITMMQWDEVLTVDKFGDNAVIRSGELARAGNVSIVPSEFVSAELNVSGIYDGQTKTKTGMVVVNADRWANGSLRGPVVETDKDITQGVYDYVATERGTFVDLDKPMAKKNAVWIYNL